MKTLTATASVLLLSGILVVAPGAARADDDGSGPVTASAESAELEQAERLYKSERWAEAAILLERITRSDSGATDEARQLATYDLAISLYRLKLYHVSLNVFGGIAEPRDHLWHKQALRWLGELASVLPDVDSVVGELGAYGAEDVERLGLPKGHRLASTLYHLLGKSAWKRRAYEEATLLFDKVDKTSELYLEAQIFAGTSYVMLRKVVPAVKRFFRAVEATDDLGVERFKDGAALRELALMSMARAYYTSGMAEPRVSMDPRRMSASVKYWGRVELGSPVYTQSLLEQSWAYFMAGDYGHALGNIHTIEAPYFPAHALPEADVMKALVAFITCRYEDTETLVARMWITYVPVRRSAARALGILSAAGGEERFWAAFVDARERGKAPPMDLWPAVEWSLHDPPILRKLAKVHFLDEEIGRLRALPLDFQRAPVGQESMKAMITSQESAILDAAALARARGKDRIAELDRCLDDGRKLLIDVHDAQKAKLEEPIRNDYRVAQPLPTGDVFRDVEHVVWPFDGEYWRDELGSYRALVISRCDR